jgi:hypothetical protein
MAGEEEEEEVLAFSLDEKPSEVDMNMLELEDPLTSQCYQFLVLEASIVPRDRFWRVYHAESLHMAKTLEQANVAETDPAGKLDDKKVIGSFRNQHSYEVKLCRPSTPVSFTHWEPSRFDDATDLAASLKSDDLDSSSDLTLRQFHRKCRRQPEPKSVCENAHVPVSFSSVTGLLKPGGLLTDETTHCFFHLLSVRDENQRGTNSACKSCVFLNSFLPTATARVGQASTCIQGVYDYSRVEGISGGQDIFEQDKVFFPINVANLHWVCVVAFMRDKRLLLFDSMQVDLGHVTYLIWTLRFLKDEHLKRKGSRLKGEWNFNMEKGLSPRQSAHSEFSVLSEELFFSRFI